MYNNKPLGHGSPLMARHVGHDTHKENWREKSTLVRKKKVYTYMDVVGTHVHKLLVDRLADQLLDDVQLDRGRPVQVAFLDQIRQRFECRCTNLREGGKKVIELIQQN